MTENPHDAIGTPTIPLEVYRYAAAVLEANQIQQGECHGVAYELGWAAAIDFLQQREVPLTPDELARILYTDHAGIQRLISSGDVFWPAAELKRANDLLSDAWGIIANAENFKHTLVCEHGHRCQDREGHTIDELTPEPIGPQVWRDAAVSWRDRWHAFMDVTATFPMDVATDCPHGYAVGKVCGVCGSGVPSDGEQDATMGDDENEELTPTERAQIAEFGAGLRAGMAEGGAEAVRHPRGAPGVRPAGGAAGEA